MVHITPDQLGRALVMYTYTQRISAIHYINLATSLTTIVLSQLKPYCAASEVHASRQQLHTW